MDYSIFLLHRFAEFRRTGMDVQQAMVEAVKKSTSSIMASGLTTVIGFAALILMRFKIGPDMGLVMAKAILFNLSRCWYCYRFWRYIAIGSLTKPSTAVFCLRLKRWGALP
ncbi:MAG: MMPL family transporter [Christensenellales bacterium]